MKELRDYLLDIKNECEYLINRGKNLDYKDFLLNEDLKKAFIRSLEVIGEASKHIPENIRKKYSQVSWKSITGMRDKLIHEYFGVNYEVVWKTSKERIPELYEVIKNIIKEFNKK